MSVHDFPRGADLATQTLERTTAPAAHVGVATEYHGNHPIATAELLRIGLVAVAAMTVWFRWWEPLDHISIIGVVALVIGGWPIFAEAIENVLGRRMTMELSMSIAIIAAAAISEFFTALVITLFVLIAELLEDLTVARGRRAIGDLLDFLPRAVIVRRGDAVGEVDAAALNVGDAVLVNPGARIPVDGTVTTGNSFVDESRITGESLPVEKTPGSTVYAGSINQSGALEIDTERIGRDTSFGKIIEAVEEAERSRAPVQRLADRLAGYLVYFALASAAVTWLLSRDIRSTISVVIVAGACGIAAGTPLAILGGIGRAARSGAVVKGGLYLEQLGRVDTVVLDKTGTVTYGKPEVRAVIPVAGITSHELLDAAAAAEFRSEHPIGKTIVSYAAQQRRSITEPTEFSYTPGRGIAAIVSGTELLVGNDALMRDRNVTIPPDLLRDHPEASQVFVARNGNILGAIAVADRVRTEAFQAVRMMTSRGIRTVLLTGDANDVARAVARDLGIAEVGADLLPEQKRTFIGELVRSGRKVAMVGDGVNDAPALIEAHVGVAVGSGTDVARESADVVLLGNDLLQFVSVLDVARRTRRIIWANFAGTLAIDGVGIALAAAGMLNPLLAAFIHVSSELTFILNSARLLPRRIPSTRPQAGSAACATRQRPID